MKIIAINGCPGAGKDLFIKMCQKAHPSVHNLSTVDYVKEVAQMVGWDGKKTEKGRKFLSDLKDAMTEYDDIPFKKVIGKINVVLSSYRRFGQSLDDVIFFVHCREPQELKKFVDRFGARTLLIRRSIAEDKMHSNHADNNVFDFDYDYTYMNEYDLDKLEEDATAFIKWIAGSSWNCNIEEFKGAFDEELY